MNQFVKILLKAGLEKKLKERKLKKAEEEEPEAKQNRKLILIAVGLGVGAVAGLCAVRSLKALRQARLEKAEREMNLDDDTSPVIKLPEEVLPEEKPEPEELPPEEPKPEAEA